MPKLRWAAIGALGCCAEKRAEEKLISIIREALAGTIKNDCLYEATYSLSEIATKRALPCALEVISNIDELRVAPKADTKAMAIKAV